MRAKGRVVVGLVCGVLALAGCGSDAPSARFEPAIVSGCPDLVGDYVIAGPADADWLTQDATLAGRGDWVSLSIEPASQQRLRLVFRRSPGTVLMEAMALRTDQPQAYREWREHALVALGARPPVPGVPYGESMLHQFGPVVALVREVGMGPSCDAGWVAVGATREMRPNMPPGEDAGAREYGQLQLSRGAERELLLRMRLSRENVSEFVFFGQPIRYHTDAGMRWHRLAAWPRDATLRVDPARLEPVRTQAQHADGERAARELVANADAWLRRRVSPDVTITLLRRTQFDPDALALGEDAVRLEVGGHFAATHDPDPFQRLLRAAPQARDIELRTRSARGEQRAYALVRFTWSEETPDER